MSRPPPPRPLAESKRRTKAEKRELRGTPAAELVQYAKSLYEPPPFGTISEASLAQHTTAIKRFNEWLDSRNPPGYSLSPLTLHSFEEWAAADLPFPPPEAIQPFLLHYAGGAGGLVKAGIQPQSVVGTFLRICAAWRRRSKQAVQPEDRRLGLEYCEQLCVDLGLEWVPTWRTPLDGTSIDFLFVGAFTELTSDDFRTRLSVAVFLTLEVVTALRPSSLLYISNDQTLDTGAQYRDFDMWVCSDGNTALIYGYYSPRYGKTKYSRDMALPLLPRERCSRHAILLVLLCLVADGGMSEVELCAYLDPTVCAGGQPRRIKIPPAWRERYLFTMNFGIKMTTVHMSYRLAKLGELLGFEGKITSYCLRHMVLRGLQADSVPYEDMQALAGHRLGTGATTSYLGRAILHGVLSIFGLADKQTVEYQRKAVKARHARYDPAAPKGLTDDQIAEAYQCQDVQETHAALHDYREKRLLPETTLPETTLPASTLPDATQGTLFAVAEEEEAEDGEKSDGEGAVDERDLLSDIRSATSLARKRKWKEVREGYFAKKRKVTGQEFDAAKERPVIQQYSPWDLVEATEDDHLIDFMRVLTGPVSAIHQNQNLASLIKLLEPHPPRKVKRKRRNPAFKPYEDDVEDDSDESDAELETFNDDTAAIPIPNKTPTLPDTDKTADVLNQPAETSIGLPVIKTVDTTNTPEHTRLILPVPSGDIKLTSNADIQQQQALAFLLKQYQLWQQTLPQHPDYDEYDFEGDLNDIDQAQQPLSSKDENAGR